MSTVSRHYKAHASENSYEQAYFYEPGAYKEYLIDQVGRSLELDRLSVERQLLDIGGGTGSFVHALCERYRHLYATVVDPYLVSEHSNHKQVTFIRAAAEIFARPPNNDVGNRALNRKQAVHQILMKEVVHHFVNREEIFRGLHQELTPIPSHSSQSPPPSILIVTRPRIDIDYPLWPEAVEVWKETQPALTEIQSELSESGFINVRSKLVTYPCQITLKRWKDMITSRFWSTFSKFTDDELRNACEVITTCFPVDERGILHFEDRLLFITAHHNCPS